MCYYLARLVVSRKGKVFGGDDYGSLSPVVSVWLILNNPRWDQGRIMEWTMAGLLGIYLSRKIGTREKVRRIERDWDLRFSKEDEEEMAMFEGSGMDLWNEAEQSGIQEGRKEELLRGRRNFAKAILTLSVSLHVPLEQAMDLLKVPRSEREELLSLINEMQKTRQ